MIYISHFVLCTIPLNRKCISKGGPSTTLHQHPASDKRSKQSWSFLILKKEKPHWQLKKLLWERLNKLYMSCQQYRNIPLKVRCIYKKTLWLSPLKGFSRIQPDSAPFRLLQDFECVKLCVSKSGDRISSCHVWGSFLLQQVNILDELLLYQRVMFHY